MGCDIAAIDMGVPTRGRTDRQQRDGWGFQGEEPVDALGVAAGTLTITSERLALLDFSSPLRSDVREVLVTGPAAAEVTKYS